MLISEIFDSVPKAGGPETDVYHSLKRLVKKHGLELFKGKQAFVTPSRDGKSVYRFWSKDDGYEEWLELAMKMQDNPHIVKVLNKVRTIDGVNFKNKVGSVKVVKLEKLDAKQPPGVYASMADFLFRATRQRDKLTSAQVARMSVDTYISYALDLPEHFDPPDDAVVEWMNGNKKFIETYKMLDGLGYNDMSGENIMYRGKVPVITDPLSLTTATKRE